MSASYTECCANGVLSKLVHTPQLDIAAAGRNFPSMAIRLRVGDVLRKRGMTAYQLAKQSGGRISLSLAYRLEQDRFGKHPPTWDMLEIICQVLEVDVTDLFQRMPPKRGK